MAGKRAKDTLLLEDVSTCHSCSGGVLYVYTGTPPERSMPIILSQGRNASGSRARMYHRSGASSEISLIRTRTPNDVNIAYLSTSQCRLQFTVSDNRNNPVSPSPTPIPSRPPDPSPSPAMSAAAVSASRAPLQQLVHRSLPSLRHKLTPTSRLASLDITPTHVTLAISNRLRDTAFPFGMLARTSKPSADALILSHALARAEAVSDPPAALDVHALVVGLPPASESSASSLVPYLAELLQEEALLPDLQAVLFYSEAHALSAALRAHADFLDALAELPVRLETRKLQRFDAAMNPKVPREQLEQGLDSKARIAATDVLQAVLDDLSRDQAAS